MVRQSMSDPAEVAQTLWGDFTRYRLGLDIGGNCGQSVPEMLARCQMVHSYEPSPISYPALAGAWAAEPKVRTFQIAVSNHEGTVPLAQLPGEQAETGQLVTPGTMGMEWQPADWSAVPAEQFECTTLDVIAAKHGSPGLVKVDTEGHELAVLMGGVKVLAAGKTDWLIEFHSPGNKTDCVDLLARSGHMVSVVRHPHYPVSSPMWRQHGWIKAFGPNRSF